MWVMDGGGHRAPLAILFQYVMRKFAPVVWAAANAIHGLVIINFMQQMFFLKVVLLKNK